MAIFEVDDNNFQDTLDAEFKKNNIVILKFGSDFCDACMALDTELEQVDEEDLNISIIAVNTDDYPEIAEAYDVYQLPTMIIFKNINYTIYDSQGVVLSDDILQIVKSSL
ncbi:thioredoxin family protein [Sulfurimonas sp.]|uniref:thioredoxin family protein n=1 Tax=Sulfurimonas sp. TaxID=2022749 RepID=UPI002B46EB79|nr:thioredoxin family protein [Sulfurimonas sp.]